MDGALWRRGPLNGDDWESMGGDVIGSPNAYNTSGDQVSVFFRTGTSNSLSVLTEWLTHGVVSASSARNLGGDFR